jgi:hypothetical protein
MIKWDDLNYLRSKLIKVENVFNMVKSHEQELLTRFLRLADDEAVGEAAGSTTVKY